MSPGAFVALLGAIFSLILGIISLRSRPRRTQHIVFAFFCLSFILWLGTTFLMFDAPTDELAEFWDRVGYYGICFAPTLMYHLSVIFRGNEEKSRPLLYLGYFISAVFVVLSRSEMFISGVFRYGPSYWPGVHAVAQLWHHLFMVYVGVYFSMYLYNNARAYIDAKSGFERARNRILLYAYVFCFVGALAFLPAYKIAIHPAVYIVEIIGMLLFAYAILRYQFMDIGYILGRIFIYVSSIGSVLAICFGLLNLNKYIPKPLPQDWLLGILFVVGLTIYQKFFVFFEKIASKYFYYTFYSAQQVLMDTGKTLNRVLEMDKLAKAILQTIIDTIKIKDAVIYLKSKNNKYSVVGKAGFESSDLNSLVTDEFFTTYFEETFSPLSYERLPNLMIKKDRFKWSRLRILEKSMADNKVALCLPLILEKDIVGVIILGEKISRDHYSEQDEQLLSFLASQASLALVNASNYGQLKTFNERLETTVKKRTEELRDANEQLQKADRLKSEFVSIASHQLRSPLTVIKGYLSVILSGDYGQLADDVKKPLQVCYDANQRLINFINDLLDLNAIEEGKMNITFAPVKLQDIIDQILKHIEKHLKEKKVEIEFIPPKEGLPEIQADASKLEQVFFNLIDNAIKYSPQGHVKISLSQLKGKQKFVIQDSGEGMTQDELDSIFEKFARGTSGKKVSTKGSGIGLFVAKKFVEAHKGKIWAESDGIGKGAKFIVELPDNLQP